jgi:hypothetical protein
MKGLPRRYPGIYPDGYPRPWNEVASKLSEKIGKEISVPAYQMIEQKALRKLRERLERFVENRNGKRTRTHPT